MFFQVLGMHEDIVEVDLMEVAREVNKCFLNDTSIDGGTIFQPEPHAQELEQAKGRTESCVLPRTRRHGDSMKSSCAV